MIAIPKLAMFSSIVLLAACGSSEESNKQPPATSNDVVEINNIVAAPVAPNATASTGNDSTAETDHPPPAPFQMSGVYRNTAQNIGMNDTGQLEFTGPGYCKLIHGSPYRVHSFVDGRCELRNGGLEFNGGQFGPVIFFEIQGNSLIQNAGGGRVVTLVRM